MHRGQDLLRPRLAITVSGWSEKGAKLCTCWRELVQGDDAITRKLRLELEGATYDVIARGNYRADVFGTEATKQAFIKCLGEAAGKSGWVVHAWCVMSNHYQLCLTTPQPNLVEGMRWLQATFSTRFNRMRNERGHVFQGRYHAPLMAPEAVGAVCHYIHLNPVGARVVNLVALADWP